MKDHDHLLHDVSFVPSHEDISIEMAEGETRDVELHDGSKIRLRKLDRDYDPADKLNAIRVIHESAKAREIATGLLYINPKERNFVELLNLVGEPLATLPESRTRPPKEALAQIMEELR
jgi:2-oxoglutarate ferredoxin oxidoreductase subunit beta